MLSEANTARPLKTLTRSWISRSVGILAPKSTRLHVSSTLPSVVVGGPVQMVGNSAKVNFTAAAVANYNFNFVDPNDPVRPTYEVRWAVITQVQLGTIVSKRILVGVYNRSNTALLPSVTVEAWVQK